MKGKNWITIDYLELLCEKNHLIIGCKSGEEEVWISPLGPHPSDLTSQEVQDILKGSSLFEIRKMLHRDPDLVESDYVSRVELEQKIKKLLN